MKPIKISAKIPIVKKLLWRLSQLNALGLPRIILKIHQIKKPARMTINNLVQNIRATRLLKNGVIIRKCASNVYTFRQWNEDTAVTPRQPKSSHGLTTGSRKPTDNRYSPTLSSFLVRDRWFFALPYWHAQIMMLCFFRFAHFMGGHGLVLVGIRSLMEGSLVWINYF